MLARAEEEEEEDVAIPEADSRGRAGPWRPALLLAAAWAGRGSFPASVRV